MAYPDMYSTDSALIAIAAKGGSSIEFSAAVSSIDIDLGDKDFESLVTINGGRLEKPTPEGDTTITFEGYVVGLDTTAEDVFQRFFTTRANWDAAEGLEVSNSKNRDNFRVAILFTDVASVTSGSATVPSIAMSGGAATRMTFQNCRLISAKPSYTGDELKVTFKFKVLPYNSAGTANITFASSDGTTTLAALTTTY